MTRQVLNDAVLRKTPPKAGVTETHDVVVIGLALRVSSTGFRSWIVRGRVRGRAENSITLTLGRADLYSLTEAREWARGVLRQMSEGKDPRQEKAAQAAAAAAVEATLFK